jgi:signal transduction histidine kinase
VRRVVAAAGAAMALLVLVVLANSLPWIGRTFPGFMLMANRVVPSIALRHWSDGRAGEMFQRQIVGVDGRAVTSAREVYDAVARVEPGTPVRYELRAPGGEVTTEVVTAQVFGATDWFLLYGAYLVNGIVFAAVGLLVFRLSPERPASLALLVATTSAALFVLTGIDLYGPHWFFRLHVFAECLMGAGFLHLALVFPSERLRAQRGRLLAAIYGLTGALVLVYEVLLWQPTAYTVVHIAAIVLQVSGTLGVVAAVIHDFFASSSPLVRRRIGVVVSGVSAGLVVPGLSWAATAVLGGRLSMNEAAFTAFLFPLSLGYAVVQRDLFEIDVVLRRSITYVVVVVATATLYIVLLAIAGWSLGGQGVGHDRPAALVALNVALLFALSPIRARVQEAVDHVFFRREFDSRQVIASLGRALDRVRDLGQVVVETTQVVQNTFFPRCCMVLEVGENGALRDLAAADRSVVVRLPKALLARLEAGRPTSRYEWEDDPVAPKSRLWETLGVEVIVPVRHEGRTECILGLGAKQSGHSYNFHDSELLETMARQVSLALTTVRTFGELERLNADLERQVESRTRELAVANGELEGTVARLQEAYALLEQSQQGLVRADRLATLGRLSAGIAHEVNTPLGAVMNALKLVEDLGREYEESIGDPRVTATDHKQIAQEIRATAASAAGWAQRAATYVSRVKGHGREPNAGEMRRFTLSEVIDEVRCLLDHRLRQSGCRMDYVEDAPGLSIEGDPARLGHVLLNLVQNAIEAYDEQHSTEGLIDVRARRECDAIAIEVRDFAGGVPPAIADRIFDELFTTKEPGKGTGLGLWIVRNLIEESFRGEISLRPVDGPGTCFRVILRNPAAEPARTVGRGDRVPSLN